LANRLASRFVNGIFLVFAEAGQHLKCKQQFSVGMPVRKEMQAPIPHKAQHKKFRLFVFGGSLGSVPINTIVTDAICSQPDWLDEVEVIHQSGSYDYQRV